MPRPQTLRRRKRPRVGLAPLSKGAGCGESRRLGDCLEAGSRSRKAAQGGTLRVGGRFRGRHFGAGQSLRPRLAARPPPFDKGGKLRGGACNQPGNRDLDVIANPCRGRFYIGPVCGGANTPGRIWNPPLHGFFQCCSQPGNHDPRVTANLCRGRCLHRPAPRGGANVPILKLPRCGGRERPPYRARETAATNREIAAAQTPRADMESAPTWVFHGIRGRPGLRAFVRNSSAPGSGLPVRLPPRRAFRG